MVKGNSSSTHALDLRQLRVSAPPAIPRAQTEKPTPRRIPWILSPLARRQDSISSTRIAAEKKKKKIRALMGMKMAHRPDDIEGFGDDDMKTIRWFHRFQRQRQRPEVRQHQRR